MSTAPASLHRVAAVLVVHDGEEWLPSVLATLGSQTYPAFDLVVVDNGSVDGSGELLERRIPAERLIRLPEDVGFGRAVAAALQHEAVASADLLLLLHDDLVLAPDAVARLAHALRQDPELSVVGPKLREWSDDDILQDVGMTVDRFGRAENRIEPGELDQGQHDAQLEVLYVSTAGMMLRLDALRTLGGFDARFPAFREDLDLCWRAWLAGHRVAVVPSAVGYHVAAGSRLARPFGKSRPWEARYLAERHTISAMLKNYSALRLLWVLPVVLLLALAKTVGFLLTRRFGDAIAVTRAYAWNLLQVGRTLRRRRIVQSRREVSDAALSHLFAPGLPRARAYAEALGNWLAGGSTRALLDEEDSEEKEPDEAAALVRLLRRHPAALSGIALLLVYVLGLLRLFGEGQIVGGDIAPWPASAADFVRSYVSPWNGDPVGSGAFGSPIQVVLGFASFLGAGSAWLAQRLVLFSLLPIAWLLALRAGRLVTISAWPRILGATLYVLSPVLLGALAQGRVGVLILGALLPGLVLLGARVADPSTSTVTAWRAAALLALGLATAIAASPAAALPVAAAYVALLGLTLLRRDERRQQALCTAVAGVAALLLLSPWLVGLVREGVSVHRVVENPVLPLWRALATAPQIVPGLSGVAGVLVAASAAGLVLAAAILGMAARPAAVTGLVAALAGSAFAAWGVVRLGGSSVWAPGLLLPAALALAGLGVVAAHYLAGGLHQHAFGLRQVGVLLGAGMLALGLAGGLARLAGGPWDALALDAPVVPPFVAAEESEVGAFRVLLLEEHDGVVWWDVTDADGPDMVAFGTTSSRELLEAMDEAVGAAAGGGDLRAGDRLGLLNVRYVILQDEDPEPGLVAALTRQPALEPLPSGGGRIFRVDTWLPRAALLPAERAERLTTAGELGPSPAVEPLERIAPGRYRHGETVVGDHVLLVSEAESPIWRASSLQGRLQRVELPPVNAFAVPDGAHLVGARAAGGLAHLAVALLQGILLLGVVSLALRPPGFTQARVERRLARELPGGLAREAARRAADAGTLPEALTVDAVDPSPLPDPLEPDPPEPEALESGALEPEAPAPEALEPGALAPLDDRLDEFVQPNGSGEPASDAEPEPSPEGAT
jgi:GT2 family glycosyltransferase